MVFMQGPGRVDGNVRVDFDEIAKAAMVGATHADQKLKRPAPGRRAIRINLLTSPHCGPTGEDRRNVRCGPISPAPQFVRRISSSSIGRLCSSTVLRGSPDHHRGLLPSRCQDGKDDRIEIGHGYGFWKLHVFPPQITADGGGHGGRAQFWMLCVDQLQHLKMHTIFQVQKRLDEYLPLFFVEFKDGCASLVDGVARCASRCRRIFFACILSMVSIPRGLDRSGGLEQIKNTLASL